VSVNKQIMDALTPLNIPVSFQNYKGAATTYITFFEYMQQGASYSDNNETNTEHFLQVDVWSKVDYTSIVAQAKTLLTAAGFRRSYETEMYEADILTYHKVLRVVMNEEII